MRALFLAAAGSIACGQADEKFGLEAPIASDEQEAYPSGDFGWNVDNVIPNMAFTGYLHLDPSTLVGRNGIGTVRFSDFYDPDGSRGLRFLLVGIHDAWCPPSIDQEDFTNGTNYLQGNVMGESFALQYAPKGVRFLTLLQQGTHYQHDATISDLWIWMSQHGSRISEALLPSNELELNVIEVAVPYNIIIDTRTMRIKATYLGFEGSFPELDALLR